MKKTKAEEADSERTVRGGANLDAAAVEALSWGYLHGHAKKGGRQEPCGFQGDDLQVERRDRAESWGG